VNNKSLKLKQMKNKKLNIVLSFTMIITTFLPWYSAQSIAIGGWYTLMGLISLIFAVLCFVLVLSNKKAALLPAILAALSSMISLILNWAIWGQFANELNEIIKPDHWSKYLSFGGAFFLLLSIVLIISIIKSRKIQTT